MEFNVVLAKDLVVKTHGVKERCEGTTTECPFETMIPPKFPLGCKRCRQIKNNILAVDWFLRRCSADEIMKMIQTSHLDWARDIDGFDSTIGQFMDWFIATLTVEELTEFDGEIKCIPIDNVVTDEDLNHYLAKRILSHVRYTLAGEFGTGQNHRQSMAHMLNVLTIVPR